ncbi:MAG: AMP-binding protein, partial [Microcoleus sp. T3-bin5]|nr:AMP-binding protein [Microcoleus sp. T3-bin5]
MNAPNPSVLKSIRDRDLSFVQTQRRYEQAQSLAEIWPIAAQRFGDTVAMHDPHGTPAASLTYRELCDRILTFASGLQALGVEPYAHVALFADNSHRWFIADQGIMTAGAANAVRSATAEKEELIYIAEHSDSTILVLEDVKLLKRLRDRLEALPIRRVVLLSDEIPPVDEAFKIVNFSQLLELGASRPLSPVSLKPDDLATLIYTSGTTGKPKGVMLTYGNLMHQLTTFGTVVQPEIGDIVLSILPSWHVYERTVEYYLLSQGCSQVYTNLRSVKKDLKEFKPNYMLGVPRLWESIYEGVQKQFREQPEKKQRLINSLLAISDKYIKARRIAQNLSLNHLDASAIERLSASIQASALLPLHALGEKLVYNKVREATGGKIKQMISGGGALPKHIDDFFEIIGVEILQGYGLTETSPVTNVRRTWRNLRGSSGQPLPGTENKIVDPETRKPLPIGEKGLVLLKGPQIMKGYYQNPEATAKAIDSEGWFDSGDLGWVTPGKDLVLTGRAKDTIVLSNGENIEPQPIEDACVRSPYIDQIMLVGQDKRSVGALIVPNLEALQKWAESQNLELCIDNDNVTETTSEKIKLESKMSQ